MTLAPILEAATRQDADEQQRAADLALLKQFAARAVPVIEAAQAVDRDRMSQNFLALSIALDAFK